jgi:phospholipid/cholesterol/gamma-HCH transport system substrate-binding protein
MPRTRSLAWAELKIGIVSVVAIALAAMLIFMLSGEGGFAWERYPMKTVFTNIAGLGEGSPVRVAGVEVGAVTALGFVGSRVEVTFEVNEDMASRITSSSVASLGSVSLLGESAVDITASTEGMPVPEWGYVPSGPAQGSIAEVATQASKGIEELTALLQDVRAGRGTAGRLFTDEALYTNLNQFITSAEAVTRSITQGRGTLGRLTNDPTLARSLETSVQNLSDILAKVRSGEGSIGKLLNDDALATSLASTTANLDSITARLNKGEGTAGKLMTDQELYNRLNSMTDRIDKVVAAIQEGDGTAGLLIRDKQLYENINGAVLEMRKLLTAIQADPKRYLNVRVSLF